MTTTKRSNIEGLRAQVIRMAPYRDYVGDIENGSFSVRYLGDWMVPEDEEDDGDYDWKVPTPSTRKMFDKLSADFGCEWRNEGEKCWVRFNVKK